MRRRMVFVIRRWPVCIQAGAGGGSDGADVVIIAKRSGEYAVVIAVLS